MAGPIWILDDAHLHSGGQLFALRLARYVAGVGRPVAVLAPAAAQLAAACRDEGIPSFDADFPEPVGRGLLRMPGAVFRARRTLAGAPPGTLVVGNSGRAALVGALAAVTRRDLRFVTLIHESSSAHRRSARLALRRMPGLAAVGENTARLYRQALRRPVQPVNNFLDGEEWHRRAGEPRPARDPGPPAVGVLSRLAPVKGILELLEELRTHPSAWRRLDVGAAPQDPAYAARVRAAATPGKVRLLGHVSDVDSFFEAIDVLVVPSLAGEGQPTVILEALGRGVPVVVRKCWWEPSFDGLPVSWYETADDLAAALPADSPSRPDPEELSRRFGAEQVVAGLEFAARQIG